MIVCFLRGDVYYRDKFAFQRPRTTNNHYPLIGLWIKTFPHANRDRHITWLEGRQRDFNSTCLVIIPLLRSYIVVLKTFILAHFNIYFYFIHVYTVFTSPPKRSYLSQIHILQRGHQPFGNLFVGVILLLYSL